MQKSFLNILHYILILILILLQLNQKVLSTNTAIQTRYLSCLFFFLACIALSGGQVDGWRVVPLQSLTGIGTPRRYLRATVVAIASR